jgi:hypothetical protein
VVAQFLAQGQQTSAIDIGEADKPALTTEKAGGGTADACGGSGDEQTRARFHGVVPLFEGLRAP